LATPKIKSPYSDTKLGCGGHACAECGNCRDWYWSPDDNDDKKRYTKRNGANCCGFDVRRFYGGYYHDRGTYTYGVVTNFDGLCECDDNQN
jgi:hypothetical protein